MPFKPNYRMQRADRKRAQEIKQQKKLERRAEKAALRKGPDGEGEAAAAPDAVTEKTGDER
jgi:hypothetical protein